MDEITTLQLEDVAIRVSKRKYRQTLSEMFSSELKFINDSLNKIFEHNIKVLHLNKSDFQKQIYEEVSPINWSEKCKIYNFYLEITIHEDDIPVQEIRYFDFLIRKEYQFVGNILDEEDLQNISVLRSLENYDDAYKRIRNICVNWKTRVK